MGSWFDSLVYARRKKAPWCTPGLMGFVDSVLYNEPDDINHPDMANDVVLTLRNRPDVASRKWYTLEWTRANGKKGQVEAQKFDLLMWRAAVSEQEALRETELGKRVYKVCVAGQRSESDPQFDNRNDAWHATLSIKGVAEVYNAESGLPEMFVYDGHTYHFMESE